MTYRGTVKNGVVLLPPDLNLADGSAVEISLADPAGHDDSFRTLVSQIATPRNLPDDFAMNHDYYLHGHSHKQQPRQGRWITDAQASGELNDAQSALEASEFASLAAQTVCLPPDLSTNHDHYRHGLPKR